ncbi:MULTISPECIES: hypothetical protein [unclassified Spirosoma]|uniref:hypothetical protein n=1 Tax=unclassified Spirosoma TaxID=2621999 RepID=UPI000965CA2A|nr:MULTISPECIES: hypothetical protein [unclassified Spirosoma]MBN8823984.1 hypothetical protein [Spirosoma sp.]OJW70395.1 MAG: hypothetical protein BGO59_24345 [Spirosoma sp. 48-14]
MKQTLFVAGFILLFGHCTSSLSPRKLTDADGLVIRTGTSAGMCIGYCAFDYELSGTNLTLTQRPNGVQSNLTTKTCQSTISQTDLNDLLGTIDLDAFFKQPTVLGCPDCADGGAEYVELQLGEQKHRVTFQYGQTIPGSEALVDRLRTHRAALNVCK